MQVKKEHKPVVVDVKDKLLWNADEASAMTGLTRKQIYDLLKNPKCPYVVRTSERNVRINSAKFREYLETHNALIVEKA